MIDAFLKENNESDLLSFLKNTYLNHPDLSHSDNIELENYKSTDYALLGVIGLLIGHKGRILLEKKQTYHSDIQKLFQEVLITYEDLIGIANTYLEGDFTEIDEFISRKVLLEYPPKEHQ